MQPNALRVRRTHAYEVMRASPFMARVGENVQIVTSSNFGLDLPAGYG